MEFGRLTDYDITIESTQNKREIVRIGCGTFAFINPAETLAFLDQYFNDPQSIRDQCYEGDQPILNREAITQPIDPISG